MTTKDKKLLHLVNGTISSLKTLLPLHNEFEPVHVVNKHGGFQFGTMVSFTGDIEAELILHGDSGVFSQIGQHMFGMPIEGELLESFTGEFGNMVAGNLSTLIVEQGFQTDISPPTLINETTKLVGKAVHIIVKIKDVGPLNAFLIIENR
ncbi:chemotaxis protein CheX [Anaerobacillus isosaccharinicus]|uniref:Chemotaxis protein CheX n=1 Tax=Anaerobacillus isosaccharinicus TaxID=1532552 RepID=A0A1S2KXB0_9BACI|nr:chemotaxis protein CheX [Anaerobacillus isosaccharinicus]MBA5586814.1 chemotaxis protein CheX [Anaerobacillus isosaccharinicus]QOY34972.1 chemotaxis protein CheX [Anaerobacillus isosaccharinicus]